MIKAVFFDIDNTLYSYDRGNEAGMNALTVYGENVLHTDRETFLRVFWQAQQLVKERTGADCAAVHNRLIRMQCILELLGKPLFPHAKVMYHLYWDSLLSSARPEEGVLQLLQRLKSKGIGIGIGTDMTAYIQYEKLEALGVSPYIDWIVTSEEAGAEKPAERFFALCAEKAGADPARCIFIGDSLEKDVKGALKNGFKGVWYHKNPTEDEKRSYSVIASFCGCIQDDCICLGKEILI